jgi:hypothetical protein
MYVLIGAIFLVLFLSFYGLFFDRTLPTTLGTNVGYVAAAFGVVYGVGMARHLISGKVANAKHPFVAAAVSILVMPFIFYTAWAGFISLYTQAFGKPAEQQVVTVSYWRYGDTKTCSGPQLVQESLFSPGVVCLPSSSRDALNAGTTLAADGKISLFGLDVTNVRIAGAAATANPQGLSAGGTGGFW